MKLEIDKIVLFRRGSNERKEYDFNPGMVNIVTGVSTTGKSTFLKILDYVFCGETCRIPDVVVLVTQWVGILFHTEGKKYFIARRLPLSEDGTTDEYFYLSRPSKEDLKFENPCQTQTGNDMLRILDDIVGLNRANTPNTQEFVSRLKFSDILNFSMQSSRTMTSEDQLFENAERDSVRKKLKTHFPHILGVDDSLYLDNLEKLKTKEAELQKIEGDRQKALSLYNQLTSSLRADLNNAKIMEFLPPETEIPLNPYDMMPLVESIMERIENNMPPKISGVALDKESEEVIELQKEADKIAEEIMLLEDRKSRIKEIDAQVANYREEAKSTCGRLEITKWIKGIWNPDQTDLFPHGGNNIQAVVQEEYNALANALDRWNSTTMDKGLFENYRVTYQNEVSAIEKKRTRLIARHEAICQKIREFQHGNATAREMILTQKATYRLIGRIESAQNLFVTLNESAISTEHIQKLNGEIETLKKAVTSEKTKIIEAKNRCLDGISDAMKEHLHDQDIPVELKTSTPRLDDERLDVYLENSSGRRRYLSRIGSTANHLAFHVALSCALEEHFVSAKKTPAARFIIFDQPNRPVKELREINHEIAKSVRESGWQAIVLVEAEEKFYDERDTSIVNSVAHFAKGEGIIPKGWLPHGE